MLEQATEQCVKLIRDADSIAALTGAGISTNAGIPDFRGPQGLYITKRYDPETVFDIHFFYKDPHPFFEFARDFIGLEAKIQPTPAHHFLADLETTGKLKGVITQNIDSLHQQAGSQNVFEMHGSFYRGACLGCQKFFDFEMMKSLILESTVARCSCGDVIKPDVVFFGENVKHLQESSALAEEVDLFFVIGTSCVVYPAAMLPSLVNGKIVIVNQDPVELSSLNVVLSVEEEIDTFFAEVASKL